MNEQKERPDAISKSVVVERALSLCTAALRQGQWRIGTGKDFCLPGLAGLGSAWTWAARRLGLGLWSPDAAKIDGRLMVLTGPHQWADQREAFVLVTSSIDGFDSSEMRLIQNMITPKYIAHRPRSLSSAISPLPRTSAFDIRLDGTNNDIIRKINNLNTYVIQCFSPLGLPLSWPVRWMLLYRMNTKTTCSLS